MYVNHAKGANFFTCNAIREKKILAKISEFTVTFLYSYFESGPMDQMLCIDFCFFSSDGRFVQQENQLGTFARLPYKKHLCEIIFVFGPVVQEMLFKDICSCGMPSCLSGVEPFKQFWQRAL